MSRHKHIKNSRAVSGLHLGTCLLILPLMTACATMPSNGFLIPAAPAGVAVSSVNTGVDHFELGNYTSSAWVSDAFTGDKARQIQGDVLQFGVVQSADEGGIDVGLSRVDFETGPVASIKKDLRVCSTYKIDLTGEGRWWAGPKISVNWQGDEAAKENGDDWYENYIVEIASSTPQELHDIFTGDYFKAEELPSTMLAGSRYRHYKIRFHSWWQFWSVRQDYRETGTLPIEPIIDVWINNGLPTNRTFDGVKANIETYNQIAGQGQMRMEYSYDDNEVLSCE